MTNEERDIQRNLKVLQHAEKIGNASPVGNTDGRQIITISNTFHSRPCDQRLGYNLRFPSLRRAGAAKNSLLATIYKLPSKLRKG